MKRYKILMQITALESESGKRVDDAEIWHSFVHEITVTEEFLEGAAIPFPLGQQLEATLREEISKHENR